MTYEWLRPEIIFGSILYAVIGIVVLGIFFVIVDKLTPYHLWTEIVDKKNVALAIVVFLHVVYGEMIPKNISIARPERSAVALVPALVMVSRVVAPVIHAMDWLAKAGIRLFGVEPKDEVASAFTAEEVAHILDESRDEGLVEHEHYERLGQGLTAVLS